MTLGRVAREAITVVALALAPLVAPAEDLQPDDFKITVSPYMWGSSLGGSSTVANTTTEIDAGFDTVLENLQLGGMLDIRLDKGRWALQLDVLYAGLGATDDSVQLDDVGFTRIARRKTDVDLDTWVVELVGHYRLTERLSVIAGARYYDMGVDVDVSPIIGPDIRVGSSESWFDPLIGLQFQTPIGERWSLGVRGDVGGFGAGSEFAWQLWALAEYHFNERASFAFGYRHLDWDYESGSGLRSLDLDMYMTGPVAGMRFRF